MNKIKLEIKVFTIIFFIITTVNVILRNYNVAEITALLTIAFAITESK